MAFACSKPEVVVPAESAARWASKAPWPDAAATTLYSAGEAAQQFLIGTQGQVRSGPFVRIEAPVDGYGRGWVDDAHFQLLKPDGTILIPQTFVAIEAFDPADRAFAATSESNWGLMTRPGGWLVMSLWKAHGRARIGQTELYAFSNGGVPLVVDTSGAAVDVGARVLDGCGPGVRAVLPEACASIEAWAGTPRGEANLAGVDGPMRVRWFCGGPVETQSGAASVWSLPGYSQADASALAARCGATGPDVRVRLIEGGAELRLGFSVEG